ncbi:MAG: carboxyl transferase domain-containing protein [Pseudomonadales bacterium]|jgi:acetyl/propionyl-CoA carboxylase alpha subunit/acetyl-CoA carboxylase carboxyltransferase component|nr:carboxyl transferase domain-containing protein [Pseudomonadales bacterium]MDP6471210.1 carboxyl transferase domain-containing protein [Pseudomonadales bacterium]MDP6825601.1 carboxyl transferase domain-containing protein [Pseudomonadales bacterium]MDP6970482.1 carboxyl transferase domain-containing protein [Pseudomonadales bacterium]
MLKNLLIANRGEIAIRIARAASDLGIATVAVYADDDSQSLHTRHADQVLGLGATGVPAYLDSARIIALAEEADCDAIHPGYGFLSELADFAVDCEKAGFEFVGPDASALRRFGDKAQARSLAQRCGVPVLHGLSHAITLKEAKAFFETLSPGAGVMLKAVAGGGGRGMRAVERLGDLDEAFARATSEAEQAFGSGEIYIEELLPRARHIEVQIVGDGSGEVCHLWDRECSLQRQRQKLVEIAPAFGLSESLRTAMLDAAGKIAAEVAYRGVGTIEFLLDTRPEANERFVFMEANARLQVEHTVTEAVTGLDLVAIQLRIAGGSTLDDLGLVQANVAPPRGVAVQARVNLETMTGDGQSHPGGGVITAYEPPAGPGVRVDGFGYTGYVTSPHYDSLLAKVIAHADDLDAAVRKARRALAEFKIEGVRSNTGFLSALLRHALLAQASIHTRYVEEHAAELVRANGERARYFEPDLDVVKAGTRVDPDDPLAVLALKGPVTPARGSGKAPVPFAVGPAGTVAVLAPLQGMLIELKVSVGDTVRLRQPVAVLEALKMEHMVLAEHAGVIREIALEVGDTIFEDTPIVFIEPQEIEGEYDSGERIDLDSIRPDVAEVQHFHHLTTDEARAEATAKRHDAGKRTARENIADLCDPGSFFEYSPLVTATRYRNDSLEELEERVIKTAADAMVMGVGRVNGDLVGRENARCVAMSYDYTVLAGTQGGKNHQKQDRMFGVARNYQLPVVLYTEGGGGRTYGGPRSATGPQAGSVGGLSVRTWRELGKLSGLVPLVGVNSGYCFAGNVVLLGACDVIIATRDSSLGIGGPAVIEGGGLGAYAPNEVGPISIQQPNGVIDILVEDEIEATAAAKHYLSFFQGRIQGWSAHDQRVLRHVVPENRRAVYNIRQVIETLGDVGSMLELRPEFGLSMVTAFIRIEGRAVGVIANNSNSPTGGAVDSDGADKASRFMQLCDAFDIPILSLIDTPGNMVGPEAEKTALIRHCGRMYVAGANITVPYFVVVLRKSYGLGALAMSTGSFDETFFSISWPTGEFAGMGLEGAVKLGRRAELLAITDVAERKARYERYVDDAYAWSRALNAATVSEVDDVIDPADTRKWLVMGLDSVPSAPPRSGKKRGWIDTW